MSFEVFAKLVNDRYNELSNGELYTTIEGDAVWARYLQAFPEGTNEIYRERTEHDCSCCKQFIRNIGNLVAIVDGEPVSMWGIDDAPYPYDTVAENLDEFVRSQAITGVFRTKERKYGVEYNHEQLPNGDAKRWNHFWANIKAKHLSEQPDRVRGEYKGRVDTLRRGLMELKENAISEIIGLIDDNSIYRGEEFKPFVVEFEHSLMEFKVLDSFHGEFYLWSNAHRNAATFRNSVIGTLAQDLSEGVDFEYAIKAFENKVAPTNYKRPTALVTQNMVNQAVLKINELGLEPALDRRLAKLSDVSVTDVIWASGSAQSKMQGKLTSLLNDCVTTKMPDTAVEDISINDFIRSIVPKTKAMSIFVKNASNMMVITAPSHADAPKLFKWDNGFGWSYTGNVTDSIKERVKKAGGSVEGYLCCRLAWDYRDDLDLHMYEPDNRKIYYGNRRVLSACGGMLDLDANGCDGLRDDPAENIYYPDNSLMRDGIYILRVHNYNRRTSGKGFDIEIEFDGKTHSIHYSQVVGQGVFVNVATMKYTRAEGLEIIESLPSSSRSIETWGIKTHQFVDVSTLMLSPNHWGDQAVGNKHYFFVLDGCKTNEKMRGMYNEFLRGDLTEHRKVFEVLGNKMACNLDPDGMAGLGFSSTRSDEVVVKCDGRLFNVKF